MIASDEKEYIEVVMAGEFFKYPYIARQILGEEVVIVPVGSHANRRDLVTLVPVLASTGDWVIYTAWDTNLEFAYVMSDKDFKKNFTVEDAHDARVAH